ncbi:T9SS type A sorting domain-containing protein [Flavobacterium degerlachei]|jgi:hypothetical protein|uniref:Por secretion system C-terminal sorting domain-containing protein n=1 Tax=Flavobacterium degerlachei TaxID=229203 RepID=A0A1H3BIE1_9FLAO|nr:T9SS type A sorting domain-containing protein [Flavobacterium degerlachei]SDX41687.1 Por secretion system C-terminal sorting domain-containing protein [Flavobacterium degerlachei]
MKFLVLFFSSFTFYGQVLHHQMISSQGGSVKLPRGLIVNQTIGQQSSIGNSNKNYIIMQGFQQSLWSTFISSNIVDVISTKTYPNPVTSIVNFQFSQLILEAIDIHIYDASGRLVFKGKKSATDAILSVDLSNLPTTQYLVHLHTNSFSYYTQIIKI